MLSDVTRETSPVKCKPFTSTTADTVNVYEVPGCREEMKVEPTLPGTNTLVEAGKGKEGAIIKSVRKVSNIPKLTS